MRRKKILWIILALYLAISCAMVIWETIEVEIVNKNSDEKTTNDVKLITLITQSMLLIQYIILIYIQWKLFFFLVKKKKERA